ncbi:MAG: type II toxin-antitoxin system VapC family toxin [Desulfobacteraceae bacterium]|nr:type II toxin-antitoxin system VapC family toxin [Desulfobacteraceae bacterium]
MKALDTNVIVRFLVKDDPTQSEIVYRAFKQAEAQNSLYWIPLLVVLETLWVLESVYEIRRDKILDALNGMILLPVLRFEAQATIENFLARARESKIDLGDLLIASAAQQSGCEQVLTFDKKACRYDLFKPIESFLTSSSK